MLRFVCLLVGVVVFAASGAAQDDVEKEIKKLQGSWKVIRSEVNGITIPLTAYKKVVVTIKDSTIQFKDGDKVYEEIAFDIDIEAKPKEIDYRYVAGLKKGVRENGIYKLDGDELTLCMSQQKQPRPKDFVPKKGAGTQILTLKRIVP